VHHHAFTGARSAPYTKRRVSLNANANEQGRRSAGTILRGKHSWKSAASGVRYTRPAWKKSPTLRKRPHSGSFPCSSVGTQLGRSSVSIFFEIPRTYSPNQHSTNTKSVDHDAPRPKDAGASGTRSHAGAREPSSEASNPEKDAQPPFVPTGPDSSSRSQPLTFLFRVFFLSIDRSAAASRFSANSINLRWMQTAPARPLPASCT